MSTKDFIDRIRDEPESEIRWALKNVTNEKLMDILIDLLEIIKLQEVRCND